MEKNLASTEIRSHGLGVEQGSKANEGRGGCCCCLPGGEARREERETASIGWGGAKAGSGALSLR